jgi:hypothetical protein
MPTAGIIREAAGDEFGFMSQAGWIGLGGGRQLKLACDGGSWSWAGWRIQRVPPAVEVVTLPPPRDEDAARRFVSPEEAAAFFSSRGELAIPSSSREARAATPLGKVAWRL